MAEHPILFKGEMTLATLDGRKTMTRRIITQRNSLFDGHPNGPRLKGKWDGLDWAAATVDKGPSPAGNPGPYLHVPFPEEQSVHRIYPKWRVGDRLWLRETHRFTKHPELWDVVEYRADEAVRKPSGLDENTGFRFSQLCDLNDGKWTPSIFMPRWASRISLQITSLAAERVREITDKDCYAEGLPGDASEYDDAEQMSGAGVRIAAGSSERHWFSCLWDSINAKPKPIRTGGKVTSYVSYPFLDIQETREHRGLPWHVIGNPRVWKIGFKLLKSKGEKK